MVAYAEMKERLMPLDTAKQRLATTEPLAAVPVQDGVKVKWDFSPDWALLLDSSLGTDKVPATVTVDSKEFQLTKDAVLSAASAFGLPGAHAKVLPPHLLNQEMDYWFNDGIGKNAFNFFVVGDSVASALVKSTKQPFSNLALLEAIETAVRKRMGSTEILVDYKFNHSLYKTDVRLVIPEYGHTIDSSTKDDEWCAGVHLSNSLIAKTQTAVEAYLFRWVCTNGAISQVSEGDHWNRRTDGQDIEDVLLWAQRAVDDVFESMPAKWSELQQLTQVNIEGNAEEILREVFRTYGVPYTQQNEILSTFADAEELSMYELMQAITELANNEALKPERADTLMRIGGSIPTALFNPLNDRLWKEGHSADPNAVSPYEVKVLA